MHQENTADWRLTTFTIRTDLGTTRTKSTTERDTWSNDADINLKKLADQGNSKGKKTEIKVENPAYHQMRSDLQVAKSAKTVLDKVLSF